MAFLINALNRITFKKFNENGPRTRPGAGNGFWLGFLLPSVLLLAVQKYSSSDLYNIATCISVGLAMSSLQFILRPIPPSLISINIVGDVVASFIIFIISYYRIDTGFVLSLITGFTTTVAYKFMVLCIIDKCPKCFTVGELLIFSQCLTLFIYCAVFDLIGSFFATPTTDVEVTTTILEAGLLHVIGVIFTLYAFSVQDFKCFSIVVCYLVGQMLFLLHIVLNGSPVLWIFNYILGSSDRILLIFYWTGCAAFAVATLALQMRISEKASTSTRKWFHIFAVMVYLPGFIMDPMLTYLASGIALAVLAALETVRKLKLRPVSDVLDVGFELFADEKDVGGLSLTPIYLLVGMSAPMVILPSSNVSVVPYFSGLLSVGVGDAAASIVGKKYGRTKWPDSSRSIEGTIANITSQLLVLVSLRLFGFVKMLGAGSLFSILINSLVEAKTDQVDNLCLPFVTLSVMLLIPEHFLSF